MGILNFKHIDCVYIFMSYVHNTHGYTVQVRTYVCILKYIVLIQHFANKEIGRTLLAGISTRIENYMATTAQVQQGPM